MEQTLFCNTGNIWLDGTPLGSERHVRIVAVDIYGVKWRGIRGLKRRKLRADGRCSRGYNWAADLFVWIAGKYRTFTVYAAAVTEVIQPYLALLSNMNKRCSDVVTKLSCRKGGWIALEYECAFWTVDSVELFEK